MDAVETRRNGILFYWKSKKLEQYNGTILYFAPLQFARKGMVRGSFNIEYQSTRAGSLPSLVKIEVRRSVRGLFLSTYGTFPMAVLVKNILLRILIKVRGACTRNINQMKQYGGF